MQQLGTRRVTRCCVAAALCASALRAQAPGQTPMVTPLTPMDAAYVEYLQYLSLLNYLQAMRPDQAVAPGSPGLAAAMTPAEVGEYLYRNGARALTVPAPGQPGSEYFSRGAELNTIPMPSSVFPLAAPGPTLRPWSSSAPELPPPATGSAGIPVPAASSVPFSSVTSLPSAPVGSSAAPPLRAPATAADASLQGSAPVGVASASNEPSISSNALLPAETVYPQAHPSPAPIVDKQPAQRVAPLLADYDGVGEMMRGFAIGALAVTLWAATVFAIVFGSSRRPSRDRTGQVPRPR